MHNLKNVTVAIPRNKLVVVTGVSGSGKSSLTMDTLFAEGQRRYAESLSSYARQFLMRMDKPDVDMIEGICPAIAIEQKVTTRTPRSTVGSMTELQDYMRLLFARIGHTYSPISGAEVKKDEVSDIIDFIKTLPVKTKVQMIVPFSIAQDRTLEAELNVLMQKGFSRLLQKSKKGDEVLRIEELLVAAESQDVKPKHTDWYILIDRIVVKDFEEDDLHRMADSLQTALYEGQGTCLLELDGTTLKSFSNRFEADGMTFETPTPNFFSFNNPYGACPKCEGFGQILGISMDLVLPDKRLSVYEDAVVCWRGEKMQEWKHAFIKAEAKNGFPIHKPLQELTEIQMSTLQKWIDEFFTMVEDNLYKVQYRVLQARYRGRTICPNCKGTRLRPDALYVKVKGTDIAQLSNMPIGDLQQWFHQLDLSDYEAQVASRILIEVHQRLDTLMDVGLNYLTLNRQANTLSGGESQRIQLTKFLGSNLTDSLYILDEPSIGLHPRDTDRLIKVLKNLRNLNNTVVVVEHDEMMMEEADHIIDMGPLASHLGGEVVAVGNYKEIVGNKDSLTGQYLSGTLHVDDFLKMNGGKGRALRTPKQWISLKGCRQHNLKNIDVAFPLNVLCVVTGVSGSGKTTLVKQTLYPALQKHFGETALSIGQYDALEGDLKAIKNVELIDQNPIGKSSRSNPVTYIKAYDDIRSLFAAQQSAKIQGFEPKHFSFNVDGGRCDTCKGDGEVVVEMQFLADVYLECESCKGKRFKDEVLEVQYKGKNISDVLNMGVDDAITFFNEEKKIKDALQPLSDVGLGYVKLGQSSNTLSGGEAQRVKLASFLGKGNSKEKLLFIFDEPTTGLHFHDISKLLKSFYALIENGHSVIVIEHNTDVIKHADWLIDIGPEGGVGGGELLYSGVPEGIKKIKKNWTAKYI
ncbi:excinuclease ABC subunit UvrA [Taibaiella sp. KBW10]|uniref:excinuclease ABC subunit UvrA n=1 Tax=Taibaiella sp. KBW10 TaxID=2153357 RepID=UPI001F1B5351|nr:excinuclease ABC subunit UvrA [Taibaiella sp. KBW10]